MNDELNHCPKCGGSDIGVIRIREVSKVVWYQLFCKKCGTCSYWENSVDGAVSKWNGGYIHER